MSLKRNTNKKSWQKQRQTQRPSSAPSSDPPGIVVPSRIPILERMNGMPSEMDQVSITIVERELGLTTTSMVRLRHIARSLPFEPSMSLVSILTRKVEAVDSGPAAQIALAEEFFGRSAIVERYRRAVASSPSLGPAKHVFAPQSLYTLMRVLIDEAYDAPITQNLTTGEQAHLERAVVACNSVTTRGVNPANGSRTLDLLAFELQIGSYYHRTKWLEAMTRHYALGQLIETDEVLLASPDRVPVAAWLQRSGLSAEQQRMLGFGLASSSSAVDAAAHPHVPAARVEQLFQALGLDEVEAPALESISASREELREAFRELRATDRRFIWERRPFNTSPFLRLSGDGGLLLLGEPFIRSWLSEGFYYRPLRIAQQEDAEGADGRTDHVQRYTAFSGQVFERYCLRLAQSANLGSATVFGEQTYGAGAGSRTSDVSVANGDDIVLFEANARRLSAEPLMTGDAAAAAGELVKLIIKKADQLGVAISALLDGRARIPGVEAHASVRIWPVVVAQGSVWQTGTLWTHILEHLDPSKTSCFDDPRVQPLQLLDAADYEKLLAVGAAGTDVVGVLRDKIDGPYRHRDLAVWMTKAPGAPDPDARLPYLEDMYAQMLAPVDSLEPLDRG